MMGYICVMDENGSEVPGSRREVDFERDREGYLTAHAELTRLAGEGCWIFDSARGE
jgi:hypothetical protein